MTDISELFNNVPTMERIIKIVQALWNGTAELISNPNDGCLACQIGDYWFYFIGMEDENLKPEEVKEHYDVFTVAQMILETIKELDETEYAYYCDILGF